MDLNRIQRLASTIQTVQAAKFVCKDKEIKVEGFSYLQVDTAQEITDQLNAAIEPILSKLEAELRKQLALCAKGLR